MVPIPKAYIGIILVNKHFKLEGGSPCLVVMRGDSCSEGCRFKYQQSILNGHFSYFVL